MSTPRLPSPLPRKPVVPERHYQCDACTNFPLTYPFFFSATDAISPGRSAESRVLQHLILRLSLCWEGGRLTRATLEGLAEEDNLELVVDGEHTSTGNTTEDVGTSTLEQGLDALLGDDLAGGIQGAVVLDGLTRGHHHTTTDGVKRVRGDTRTGGDAPTEREGGQEVVGQGTDQDDRLDRVVHTEVQTTVDDDTKHGRRETAVETGNTVGCEGLPVDIDETVELTSASALRGLRVVGQTGTSVVERVDEEQGSGTSSLVVTVSKRALSLNRGNR